jgi:hypothetical protein
MRAPRVDMAGRCRAESVAPVVAKGLATGGILPRADLASQDKIGEREHFLHLSRPCGQTRSGRHLRGRQLTMIESRIP